MPKLLPRWFYLFEASDLSHRGFTCSFTHICLVGNLLKKQEAAGVRAADLRPEKRETLEKMRCPTILKLKTGEVVKKLRKK